METITGIISGVELVCTSSFPILENSKQIYTFVWDDSNLSNTIWKTGFIGTTPKVIFKNSRTGVKVQKMMKLLEGNQFYQCEVPTEVLTESGYLYITIVLASSIKRILTAQMSSPLSILKSGDYSGEIPTPQVKDVFETIVAELSNDESIEDNTGYILSKESKEDYDFKWIKLDLTTLQQDSEHRLVTDEQIAKWDKGGEITQEELWIFDCGSSTKNI